MMLAAATLGRLMLTMLAAISILPKASCNIRAADAHDARCNLKASCNTRAADAHDARCNVDSAPTPGRLMLMLLVAISILPQASCNTRAADAHDPCFNVDSAQSQLQH